MAHSSNLSIDSLLIHAGQSPDPTSGAVMTPIVLSSTFAQSAPGVHQGFEYSRTNNPTRQTLEHCLAAIEGAKHGLCFASGCAAMTTLLHTLKPGDHILAGDDLYGGSFRILDKVMKPMGINYTQVDFRNLDEVKKQITPATKMLWLETPTNPMLKIVDIQAVTGIAKGHDLDVVVDNTFATPMIQKPLSLGATYVIHSMTKYLNGHSDVVGGCIMLNDDAKNERLRFFQNSMGAIPSPFDSYMVLRGLKTLHVRMERHNQSAQTIAEWLQKHPEVEGVIYPGLPSHPEHAVAKKQMCGFGGMISFVIKGDLQRSNRFFSALKLFACAESLGGVESLIELPAIMTHGAIPKEQRAALGITDGFIRVSVGLEGVHDLIADLDQALNGSRL